MLPAKLETQLTFNSLKPLNEFRQLKLTDNIEDSMLKIERLEASMPKNDLQPSHYYGNNVYVREIFFKAGTIATGITHRHDHVSIMISGHMTIWTPEDGVHDVFGPHITEVRRGMKRAGYAHKDTHWVCAFGVPNELPRDEILDFLKFDRYADYLSFLDEDVKLLERSL
jgi:hypothetical protein